VPAVHPSERWLLLQHAEPTEAHVADACFADESWTSPSAGILDKPLTHVRASNSIGLEAAVVVMGLPIRWDSRCHAEKVPARKRLLLFHSSS
jgi:hypothetical protein